MDEERIKPTDETMKLVIPAARLRRGSVRTDNFWLRECLGRLLGLKLSGEYKNDQWGCVIISEWRIINNGSSVELHIPPSAVAALRSPSTFAKLEVDAAHKLPAHAKRIYGLLADKKRQSQKFAQYSLAELKGLIGVDGKKSYDRWSDFKVRVLDPAIYAINDFGTVYVNYNTIKSGRTIVGIRFDWKWKDPREAAETAEENDRHSSARRKEQSSADAPPMIVSQPDSDWMEDKNDEEAAQKWWRGLAENQKDAMRDKVGRTTDLGLGPQPRRERDFAGLAFALKDETSE